MKTYIACINLYERPDRLKHFHSEIKKISFIKEYELFQSKRIIPGWLGCKQSYLNIFNRYKNFETFGILEDDVMFLLDAEKNLYKAFLQLPGDWDMLYLGGYPMEPVERYSENLFIARIVLTTHAILYNTQNGIVDFILNEQDTFNKIDVFFSRFIQEKFNCFICYPMVATQWENPSDICQNSDYSFIEQQYNRFCHD